MKKTKVVAIFIVITMTIIQVWAVKPSLARDKPNIVIIWSGNGVGPR